MDEQPRGREHHSGSNGRRLGLPRRAGVRAIGCALGLALVVASTAGSSFGSTIGLSRVAAPDDAQQVGSAASTDRGVAAPVATTSADDASPMALQQVFEVLARAERAATEAGRTTTPQIEQAAGELGMLLASFLATHPDAAAGASAGSRTTPSLVAPTGDQTLDPPQGAGGASKSDTRGDDGGSSPGVGASHPSPAGPVNLDVFRAAQPDASRAAADWRAPHLSPTTEDEEPSGVPAPGAVEDDTVTFADVWAATLRLAALLDPAQSPGAPVAPDAAPDEASTPLTVSLRAAVAQWGNSTDGYLNGRIPAGVLCGLDFAPGQRLRCDAADQLERLDTAYRAQFGTDIPITDSYRPYDAQVRVKAEKGWLAATPGYSNHGWGLAVDLGSPISTGASAPYLWLRLHSPDYGWDNPSWARLDGSKPEPWHFEFFAAGPVPNRALSAADVDLWQADQSVFRPAPVPAAPAPAPAQTTPPLPTTTPEASAPEPSTPGGTAPSPSASPLPTSAPSTPAPGSPEPTTEPTTPSPSEPSDPSDPSEQPSPTPPEQPSPTPPDAASVVVPDVTGLATDDALTVLGAMGFGHVSVSDQAAPSDTVAAGLVAASTPAAGSSESSDAAIVLVLSSGPTPAPGPTPTPSAGDSAVVPASNESSLPRRFVRRRSVRPPG